MREELSLHLRAVTLLMLLLISASDAFAQSGTELRAKAFELFAGTVEERTRAIAVFEEAAGKGDGVSMGFLGDIYATGNGVPADRAKAIKWYTKAAQAGHHASVDKLAEMASGARGSATAPSPLDPGQTASNGASLPQMAAALSEDGVPYAAPYVPANTDPDNKKTAIALRREGLDLLRQGDAQAAFEKLRASASKNDAWALAELAGLYFEGIGVPQDVSQAKRQVELALDRYTTGYAEVVRAALLLDQWRSGHPARLSDEPDWLDEWIGKQLETWLAETDRRLLPLQYEAAYRILELPHTSDANQALARRSIAFTISSGYDPAVGKVLDDPKEIAQPAAVAGAAPSTVEEFPSSEAQDAFFQSMDTADYRNNPRMPEWRRQIKGEAESGLISAMTTYAFMLRHGLGGSIDPEGFFKWTKKAIELGDEAAYVALGDAYAGGIGTKRDYSAAIVSFEKAIAVGREIARKRLAEVQEDKRFWESLTPGLDWPTEDRWGSFEVGGSPAVGIADEHALLAVVCLNNELMVLYTPGGTPFFDVRPQEAASLLLMPDNGSGYVFDTAAQASYFVTDTASVRDLIGVFTRANSIKVGITDAPNAQQFFLYDSATFTGRGSSAAIKTISNNCG